MNDYSEILETRGDYRVSITPDDYPEPPDWDGQGTIIQLDTGYTGRAYVMHRTYHDSDRGPALSDDFGLADLWNRWHDMALIERYLRIFHGVVGFDYFDDHTQTRGAKYVCVVTEGDLREWGFDTVADFHRANPDHDNPASQVLVAWRAWTEGEVYYWTIERRAHAWQTVVDFTGSEVIDLLAETDDDDEGAWETVEQVHGYYGHTDAERQAREAFSGYVSNTEGVPA